MRGNNRVMRTLHGWFWFYIDMPRRASLIFFGTLFFYFVGAHAVGII